MGLFYFDESIQQRAGFIIGAFVYSEGDLTPPVFEAIASAGLRPGVDEFKSGARMDRRPELAKAREALGGLLKTVRIGLIVVPARARGDLGTEALAGLEKIIRANGLMTLDHRVYFDEGITIDPGLIARFGARIGGPCEVLLNQDSKSVGGIQVADLAAHSMGVMLLEHQGHLKKTVKAGENSGYDPDLDIELGFELWASLRYAFFKAAQPIPGPDDPLGDLMFDVATHGLHIARSCDDTLRDAAVERFGECYLGCIH
jgi:hypothetical protein